MILNRNKLDFLKLKTTLIQVNTNVITFLYF